MHICRSQEAYAELARDERSKAHYQQAYQAYIRLCTYIDIHIYTHIFKAHYQQAYKACTCECVCVCVCVCIIYVYVYGYVFVQRFRVGGEGAQKVRPYFPAGRGAACV